MIVTSSVNEITLSNVGATGEFKIRNSPRAFSILSSGLYSNKIKAIIRELSTNAVDSHVAAGKRDVPFTVHLPSTLEPWFSVQDYGLGLTGDQVTDIYTVYFSSTKTGSNDFVGALGLGSKSPFSYTENFTVTAVKDGTKRIYSAYINDLGVPSIAEMSTVLTDDINGVEIKFSVTNKNDYNSFAHEARQVFMWFKDKPEVTGAPFTHETPLYKEKNVVPGVHILDHWSRQNMAIMGNIAYPLDNISEPEKHFGDLASLLKCGICMEFNIGELDFAASREELSYVPLTIDSIRRKLTLLNDNLVSHLAEQADAITDEWARAEFLYASARTRLYGAAVDKYALDTKFELYDKDTYRGQKIFMFTVPELAAMGISIEGSYVSNGGSKHSIGASSKFLNSAYVKTMSIPVDTMCAFVLNDLKTGCVTRARYHYANHNDGKAVSVYSITHSSDDLTVRQVAYDAFIKKLHNPPNVVNASTLTKREPAKREPLSNTGIMVLNKKPKAYGYYRSSAPEYAWVAYDAPLTATDTYYYVCLNNYEPETITGEKFNAILLRSQMDTCGITGIADIKIVGVRKNRIKDIKGLRNWIWIEDKLKVETAKVSDSDVRAMVSATIFDGHLHRAYSDHTVAAHLPATSDYAKYLNSIASIKVTTGGNVDQLVRLCAVYGKPMQVDQIKKELTTARSLVIGKYPLVKHLSGADSHDIASYIKMVDSLPTI